MKRQVAILAILLMLTIVVYALAARVVVDRALTNHNGAVVILVHDSTYRYMLRCNGKEPSCISPTPGDECHLSSATEKVYACQNHVLFCPTTRTIVCIDVTERY